MKASLYKQISDELHFEQEKFNVLVDTIPTGILQVNSHGKVTTTNRKLQRILGANESELLEDGFINFIYDDYKQDFIKQIEKAVTFDMDGNYLKGEFQIWAKTKHNEKRLMRMKYKPIFNGRFRGCLFTVEDLTDEIMLLEKLDLLINQLPNAVQKSVSLV